MLIPLLTPKLQTDFIVQRHKLMTLRGWKLNPITVWCLGRGLQWKFLVHWVTG